MLLGNDFSVGGDVFGEARFNEAVELRSEVNILGATISAGKDASVPRASVNIAAVRGVAMRVTRSTMPSRTVPAFTKARAGTAIGTALAGTVVVAISQSFQQAL